MKYQIHFRGRRIGQLGTQCETITRSVEAADEKAAALMAYDTHEHIHMTVEVRPLITLDWKQVSSSQWSAKNSSGQRLYVGPDADVWTASVWGSNGFSHDVSSSDPETAYAWPTREAAQEAAEEYARKLTTDKEGSQP